MKKALLLVFSLASLSLFSQELVKTLNLKLAKKTDVFQIVEKDKKQISLFFNDKKNVRTLRFDDNFDLIDSLSTERPNKNYENIIGYSSSNNSYYTYWTSFNDKEIVSQCFNFDTKQVSLKTYTLEFFKEKSIERITVNNIFYLISILEKTSIVNIYIFKDGQMEKKTVDLSNKAFIDWENKRTNLWEIFNTSTDIQPALSIQNILPETPPSLVFSASKRKAFINNNILTFTFDCNKNFTQLLNLNLTDFSVTQKSYSQPYIEPTEFNEANSNSFLLNDKLVQMKFNATIMYITFKDLDDNEIKKYTINSKQEIEIKNSEIIQENGSIKDTRILDKSNQLLRKIDNLNSSISCYTFNDKIYTTIGSVSVVKNNNAIMYGGMIGGFTGALIGAAISSNYSVNNLNSYNNRKVVYINSIFDMNFNHIDGTIKKLAFDELRALANEKNHLTSQTVFKLNSNLYFGGYDKSNETYSFYKFKD